MRNYSEPLRKRLPDILPTLGLVILVAVVMSSGNITIAEPATALIQEINLLEALEQHSDHSYTRADLRVVDMVVGESGIHQMLLQVPKAGIPPTVVQTDHSGRLVRLVPLPSPGGENCLDLDDSGSVYIGAQCFGTILKLRSDGTPEQSAPTDILLESICADGNRGLSLCAEWRFRQAGEESLSVPFGHFLAVGRDNAALVDGVQATVRFLGESSVTRLEAPELAEARRKNEKMFAQDETGSPVLVLDSVARDKSIYLLLGSGTPGDRSVVLEYEGAQFVRSFDFALPRTEGGRQLMSPHFVGVYAGRFYLGDVSGNILIYPVPR